MLSELTHQSITFLPIFHYRVEFAAVVRAALLEAAARGEPPEVVAVELPGTWRETVLLGVNRLPYLSLVLDESGDSHLYLPIEPADGGIEALRTAKELGVPVELIDLDVGEYPFHHDPLPDSFPVHRLGYDGVMPAILAESRFPRGELDEQRETMMAHALQQLAQGGRRVTCVLGVAHLGGVMDKLASPQPRPFARARKRELRLYNWSEKSSREFMTEAPFVAAAYERGRRAELPAGGTGAVAHRAGEPGAAGLSIDRETESEAVLREAVAGYAKEIGGEDRHAVTPHQFRLLGNYARKYARVEDRIVPDLYQLVVAARGIVDDTYARHVWELGSHYPWQDGSGLLPTIDVDDTFAYIGSRKLTLRRTLRHHRPRLRGISDKRRAKERYPGQWKTKWSGRVICSHVPEDLVVESFGRYLQQRAKGMLSAERTRTEPFSVSMKDGLDLRETVRNWHEGQLYVTELQRVVGDVGSVVVVFDEDRPPTGDFDIGFAADGGRFPWLVTWLGEHEQESDMALYATPAGDDVVGPGISRCEYGGFVMSYPPRRMFDVWADPFFDAARTKAERLLLAGLDYCEQRYVVYIAEKPPRAWFRSLATRMDKQLVYIPIGQVPRATISRIRTFHVLEGHNVREYAGEYID
ncbi:MAG: hypothetical protein O7D96_00955 [SAR324 cluster bacterium]|nr:hypothetical protein [SAR324 cluster bacterium]